MNQGAFMIDLKSKQIGSQRVLAIVIHLPMAPLHFIINTKGFLCGAMISMSFFETSKACVCQMSQYESDEALLNSQVLVCNATAVGAGIKIGMSGQEAMHKMNETET